MDLKEIQELIKIINRNKISEVKIEEKDFKITVRSRFYQPNVSPVPTVVGAPMAMPVAQTGEVSPTAQKELAVNSPKEAETKASQNDNLIEIKSPMIGTFYRASSPDKPPFVKVGDHIEKGTVLCVIEAMKLFNEIESEVSGTIVKVMAENSSPIEYDQVVYLVDPS